MEGKINYVMNMAAMRCYKTITHDELNKWDFPTPLFESIKDNQYVHLYFDFDFDFDRAPNVDYDDLYSKLEALEYAFGDFAMAGYCCDKKVYDRFNSCFKMCITLKDKTDKLDKAVSMHVYYPYTRILRDELHEIMASKRCSNGLIQLTDVSVYKRTGKEQLFRHPYANKVAGDGKGCDMTDYEPSELTVTCTGNEPIITREKWLKHFPFVDAGEEPTEEVSPEDAVEDVDMSLELFEALYKGFEGLEIHGDAGNKRCDEEITLVPLLSAIYKCKNDVIDEDAIDDAIDFIKDNAKLTANARAGWRDRRKQARANKTCRGPGALFVYLKTFNADYYNSTIKPLLPKRAEDLNDVEFDLKDSFSIGDIRSKGAAGGYQVNGDAAKLDYNAVLNDLRRCMLVVDRGEAIYVFKERDARNDRMTTNCYKDVPSERRLKQLKVGTEAKDDNKKDSKTVMRSAWDVYNASTNNAAFYKDAITFYSDKPNDFSFFQGYKYEEVQNDALIEAFNRHIKHIWCKDNEEYYTYVQDWFATIIQKPLGRARTAIVVKGIEGTGKNTITDVWCELLAGYANPNVSDMDSIAGKFNTSLENKKLLVCNEMNSVELSGANLHNSLKKLITEDYVDIHTKNVTYLLRPLPPLRGSVAL